LAFLAAHDSDPFNRWEAGQRLATRCVLGILGGAEPARRCAPLVDAIPRMLDDPQLDPAFREQMLVLPTEGVIAEQLDTVDPAALRAARDALRGQLASRLAERWQALYASLATGAPWQADARAAGE